MLKVLLVEDDSDLATAIIDYMELESIEVDYAADGQIGYNLLTSETYDAVILDLNLPRLNGLDLSEKVRSEGIETPILMLTARDTLSDKLEGFSRGADDYLVKPFEMEELIVRIQVLSKRKSGQVSKLVVGDLEFDVANREVKRQGQLLKLSPIAAKILEVLMRTSPSVVSREKIIQAVWGSEQPDSNSLKVHIFNLRKQVDQAGFKPLIHTIPNFGFAIRAENDSEGE